MAIYVFLLVVLLAIGLIARESDLRGRGALRGGAFTVAMAVLFLVAAVRGDGVGADTHNYQIIFTWAGQHGISEFLNGGGFLPYYVQGVETGYYLYNHVLYAIWPNPQAITVANSALFCGFAALLFWRESPDPWLSAFLFLGLAVYQTGLNLAPSSIAACMVVAHVRYAREGSLARWIVAVCAAAFFLHTSALIFFPLFFIYRIPLDRARFFRLVLAGSAIAVVGMGSLLGLASRVAVVMGYGSYLEVTAIRVEQLLVLLQFAVVFMAALYFSRGSDDAPGTPIHYWNALLLGLAYLLSTRIGSFARVSLLFMPLFCVSVPFVLSVLRPKVRARALNGAAAVRLGLFANPYDRAAFFIIGIVCVSYVGRLLVNNIGMTMPWVPFW